ncbi:MAG: cytochrome c [Myxococcota bacterium]|jgi:mono/diheme cytochrome c family protein|nr:cytochrome c [Myxococcota bacterium]
MTRLLYPARVFAVTLATVFASLAIACGGSDEPKKPATTPQATPTQGEPPAPPAQEAPPTADPAALAARGKGVYAANCIACHNPDPKIDGSIGPAVAGASLALLEARIMRQEYPEGYTPRRDTALMVPLPYLEPDIPALAAFLAPGS